MPSKPNPPKKPFAFREKVCPGCNSKIPKARLVCHCGRVVWELLGGGHANGYYSLLGELDLDLVMSLIDGVQPYTGGCAKIVTHRIPFGTSFEKIRIRNTFAVFKNQPNCVACGEPAVKWLMVRRPPILACNLILVTKDYVSLTVDHKVAKGVGGADTLHNLVTMCWTCNNDKGKMSYDDYLKHRKHNSGQRHA